MGRTPLVAAVIATSLLALPDLAGAQTQRERLRLSVPAGPAAGRYEPERGWARPSYSIAPGYRGTITATTPNESGNLGGPYTGGGGGGP